MHGLLPGNLPHAGLVCRGKVMEVSVEKESLLRGLLMALLKDGRMSMGEMA